MMSNWGMQEFAQARVWDPRCARSLGRIAQALVERQGLSFSAACGAGLRQAAHRIFEHQTTSLDGLLSGHVAEAQRRLREQETPSEPVLVAQDTTEFNYAGHRATTGLGYLSGRNAARGLIAHAALALTPAGLPLGVLHLEIWAREWAQRGKKYQRLQRTTQEKESQKWLTALAGIEESLPAGQPAVILADREADFYDYFAAPRRAETHLLVRACQPRRVEWEAPAEPEAAAPEVAAPEVARELITDLATAVAAQAPCGAVTVAVPARPGQVAREARLVLRYVAVRMQVPRDYRRRHPKDAPTPQPVPVWVVEAREETPPPEHEPLHWLLLTTLPITGPAACKQVLHYYTQRWSIERLHFTLKSGLGAERLQIDDAQSLQHALAVYYVVAWQLLWLTHLARLAPAAPATEVLTETELQVLAAVSPRPVATRRDVVRAIAKLGGFPGNPAAGEPGVKTLWLGLRQFHGLVQGWCLHQRTTYDPR